MSTNWSKFRQGGSAYCNSKMLIENPYEINSADWKFWREGWISASLA